MKLPTIQKLLLALLAVVFLTGDGFADRIVARMTTGEYETLQDVIIEGIGRLPDGTALVGVRFPDGQSHPVPLTNVRSIRFGQQGEGRQYDLLVGTPENHTIYSHTLVRQFRQAEGHPQGGLIAVPPDRPGQEVFLPTRTVIAMLPAGEAVDTPGGQAPRDDRGSAPREGTSPRDDMDPFDRDPSDSYSFDRERADDDSMDDLFFSDDDDDYDFFDSGYDAPIDPTIELVANIIQYILMAMMITTTIWLAVYAFSNEDNNWGIAILLGQFCCGLLYPAKFLYAFQYRGSGRPILLTLVMIELLLWLAAIALIIIAGAAIFAMLAAMG